MQVAQKHPDDPTSIADTGTVKIPTAIREKSAHDYWRQCSQILEPNLPQIRVKLSEVVPVERDGLLTQSALATQVRKEAGHALGERLARDPMTCVANESRNDQAQHLLNRPADLPGQAWSRRPGCAPMISPCDPVADERIDVRREILISRRAFGLRECSNVHQHRHRAREILGGVTPLDKPRGVLLDG